MRCAGPRSSRPSRRSAPRDERPAARRHRRGHGDRQDRAWDPAGRSDHRPRPARNGHLGRFAPGVPRPRHRDRQGHRRRSGARRRTSVWTSWIPTSRSASPTTPHTRGPRSTTSLPRVGSPFWSEGRGSTCAPSPAASTPTALPSDPELRARLETDLTRDGLTALVDRLEAARPVPDGHHRPAQPAPRRPRARDRRVAGRSSPSRSRAAIRARSSGSGCSLLTAEHQHRIATRARAQFDAGLIEEARALRERFDPALPAFSAIGYHEAWAVLDGELTRDAAIELDTRRNIQFAKRQATWFRGEPDVHWLDAASPTLDRDAAALVDALLGP